MEPPALATVLAQNEYSVVAYRDNVVMKNRTDLENIEDIYDRRADDQKPLIVVGHLAVVEMGDISETKGFGFVRVDLVIPPEPGSESKPYVASADELFTFLSNLGGKAIPFMMTIGDDSSE
ncbi:hypothetical protein LCGC14_2095030 [marine sediment metagenome]|uniref:Uncharacterized protein n=1 Tax=marine sediment metagenome TaxID=412755 RepID=A0A0F9EBK3_9ZZZZ